MVECIFCKIVRKESKAHILYEDSSVIAFLDIKPRNPGHTLVIPGKHFETIFDIDEETMGKVYKVVKNLAPIIVNAVKADGVNIIQSNIVSQGVNHFHTHVIPRFFHDGMPIVWEFGRKASEEELSVVEKKIKGMM
jgi:histidine triad (HIT) family protein